MMTIFINNKAYQLAAPSTVATLLQKQLLCSQPIAVALNNQFVPRAQWPSIYLQEQDRLDLITPMQGG